MSNYLSTVAIQEPQSQRISASSLMMNPDSMDRIMRMADMMASGKSTIPAHLQKNPADCMAVVLQAMTWGMLPHVVAQKTHIVNGQLGYEAQLVNAVVQESGCITGAFKYEFKGNSPSTECRVGAVLRGESEITWGEWLSESKVTTKNSPLWKTNPKQQLGYLQVKNWARLYAPGAILGVYTPDEFEAAVPRDMGPAQEVKPTPAPLGAGVLESAQSAAEDGVATYAEFWKSASADTRKAIGKDEHNRLKDVATASDKARTVDTPPAHTARTPKTFEQVMTGMVAAQNLDALYVASEFMHDITDPDESAVLAAKFDELRGNFEEVAA